MPHLMRLNNTRRFRNCTSPLQPQRCVIRLTLCIPVHISYNKSIRVFPSLNTSQGTTSNDQSSGTVWGASLLVAGTTVGAGILALPAVTAPAGFIPSTAALLGCCLYSIVTGLLLAEVSLSTLRSRQQQQQQQLDATASTSTGSGTSTGTGSGTSSDTSTSTSSSDDGPAPLPNISLLTMARRSLGPRAATLTGAAYLFLHYSLLVAYIAKAGQIVTEVSGLYPVVSAAGFAALFAGLCYSLSTRALEAVNGGLVAAVAGSFLGLVAVAGPGVDLSALLGGPASWSAVETALPVIALSFVYQNVVPVVVQTLGGDPKKIRTAICTGVAIPLIMFVVWEGAILGSVPPELLTPSGADGQAVLDPLAMLQERSPLTSGLVQAFSFSAIVTSYIGFVLALTEFVGDAANQPSEPTTTTTSDPPAKPPTASPAASMPRWLPYLITILPPLGFALVNPGIFFTALDVAGTYGVMYLFGVLPAVMAWRERYGHTVQAVQATSPLPGTPSSRGGSSSSLTTSSGSATNTSSSSISSSSGAGIVPDTAAPAATSTTPVFKNPEPPTSSATAPGSQVVAAGKLPQSEAVAAGGELVPGGRPMLLVVAGLAALVFLRQAAADVAGLLRALGL